MTEKAVVPNIELIMTIVDQNSKDLIHKMLLDLITFIDQYRKADHSVHQISQIRSILAKHFPPDADAEMN